MRTSKTFLIQIFGMVMFAMPLVSTAQAEMTLRNVQIQNCSADGKQCLQIRAAEAEVSELSPIYFMRNIEIEKHESKRVTKSTSTQGYLDLNSNQLVIQSIDKNGTSTEEVINLTTLNSQVFVTR